MLMLTLSHLDLPVIWLFVFIFFFFNDTATTEIYTLSLHDALPISDAEMRYARLDVHIGMFLSNLVMRSEEHTSELQSPDHLVCRLLLEKKNHLRSGLLLYLL